jgi:hypothetical protein
VRRFCLRLVLLAGSAAALPCAATAAREKTPAPADVQDLAYGEVLFYFYQGKYFDALTRLLAAQERDELPHHEQDAELLLGGLYLSYGEHLLAGQIFENALQRYHDPAVRDRAWFFLAKIWYQRGYLDKSESALERIEGPLDAPLESERRMLHAEVLMAQQRFDEALTDLEQWKGGDDAWVAYAKYNAGVALVRLGRVEEGAAVLDELGVIETEDPKLAALRDKANVALGYAWLQASQPLQAKPSLERVRLNGPYSNKALLGAGWADAQNREYRAALVPWTELRGRSLLDSAVQESLLAVPYAFAQLGADKQAADYYTQAIGSFDREIERVDASIESVQGGALLERLLAQQRAADGSGWYWQLERVPDSDESRYLYDLLSTNRFQEGLKNYRDLEHLNETLDRWADSLTAFDDILDTRQRAYVQRLPAIDASLGRIDLDRMAQRRVELASRLEAVERREDAVALGTAKQQSLWRDLQAMEPDLARLGGGERADALRDKQRFLKGLLLWDLERDYKARLWAQKKNLRELGVSIKQAQRLHNEVRRARDDWPDEFAALTSRIGALRPRVEALQARAQAALARQRGYLAKLAVEELEARRARLNTYRVQARFALAAIYDRAAANAPPAAGPGTVAAKELQ